MSQYKYIFMHIFRKIHDFLLPSFGSVHFLIASTMCNKITDAIYGSKYKHILPYVFLDDHIIILLEHFNSVYAMKNITDLVVRVFFNVQMIKFCVIKSTNKLTNKLSTTSKNESNFAFS